MDRVDASRKKKRAVSDMFDVNALISLREIFSDIGKFMLFDLMLILSN